MPKLKLPAPPIPSKLSPRPRRPGVDEKVGPLDHTKEAGKDVGEAGKDVGKATATGAKKTGKAVKRGTKKATHAAASETEKGAEKVKDKTK